MAQGLCKVPGPAASNSFSLALLEPAMQLLSLRHHRFRPEVCGIDIIWVTILEGQATSPCEFLEQTTQE